MEMYTIQMSQWRIAKEQGILFIDTTVRSGHKECAPTWAMVKRIKTSTEENLRENRKWYIKEYKKLLFASYKENRVFWETLLTNELFAIACFCPKDTFCHRYILRDFIKFLCKKKNIPFTYKGELVRKKNEK